MVFIIMNFIINQYLRVGFFILIIRFIVSVSVLITKYLCRNLDYITHVIFIIAVIFCRIVEFGNPVRCFLKSRCQLSHHRPSPNTPDTVLLNLLRCQTTSSSLSSIFAFHELLYG